MRALLEILCWAFALGLLFTISRGFPQFGAVVGRILFHPLGWIVILAVGFSVYRLRARSRATRSAS